MSPRVGLTGGCRCGAVRYRLDAAPFDAEPEHVRPAFHIFFDNA